MTKEQAMRYHTLVEQAYKQGYKDASKRYRAVPEREKGEWVLKQRGKFIDIVCSKCEYVRKKDYAYNFTVEEIEKEFNEDNTMPNFCECCGADMRGGKK